MRRGKFIGVPKHIVNNHEDISLVEKYRDRYMMSVYYSLRIRILFDYATTNIRSIVNDMGIPFNQKIAKNVKQSILNLNKEQLIYLDESIDFHGLKPTDSFKYRIFKPKKFFKLYLKAYDLIMFNENLRTDTKLNMLNVYMLIQSYMYNNSKNESALKNGRYAVCFPQISLMCETLNISNKTVVQSIDALEDLDLIRHKHSGLYQIAKDEQEDEGTGEKDKKEKKKFFNGANCYTNFTEEYDEERKKYYWEFDVDGAIKYYRENMEYLGYVYIDKKAKNENEKTKKKGKRGDW